MVELGLEIINLEGLVKKLNSAIPQLDERIELKQECLELPKNNRQLMTKGKYSLFQNFDAIDNLFYIFLSPDSEEKIGSISFARGFSEPESNYSPIYEKIKLRIDQPIRLRKGEVLPACEVNLLVEEDEFVGLSKYREDYIPRSIIGRKRSDLSKILPTEWFLRK